MTPGDPSPSRGAPAAAPLRTRDQESDAEDHAAGLDHGVECHMEWTRRLLRVAARGDAPTDDIVGPDAHERCAFGLWMAAQREWCEGVDEDAAARAFASHRDMHDAAGAIAAACGHGRPPDAALHDRFEAEQRTLYASLSRIKTLALARAAHRDALTGLATRQALGIEVDRTWRIARRRGHDVAVLLIDVDHFKEVNDTHGHPVGDRTLQEIARALAACARAGEPVLRYGGEEFLVLLIAAGLPSAAIAGHRFLDAVRSSAASAARR